MFEVFVCQQLGPEVQWSSDTTDEGDPVLRVPSGESLILEEDEYLFIDDEDEDTGPLEPLLCFGPKLRRIHDFLSRFPVETRGGGILSLAVPASGALWSDEDGLSARVRVSSGEEGERVLVTAEALSGDDWTELLAAFDARMARHTDVLRPDDACLEIAPALPDDDGWDAFADALDLASLPARVAPIAREADRTLVAVRAHYTALYGLELPSGLARLAALISALGELPVSPEPEGYGRPTRGWARGNEWLWAALRMTSSGVLQRFVPGGLERATPDGLDPRLDNRYRRDAPQFVTFLSGDSDGLHWGFWYDSPAYFPVVASNYARDSAETSINAKDVVALLVERVATTIDEVVDELRTYPTDDELRSFSLGRWRALRVVSAHIEALGRDGAAAEPRCPWPRTEGYPVGSPPLALCPGSGTVPHHVPGFSRADGTPSVAQRRRWIAEARRELDAGRPAYAHALGLYLHWLDADDLREAAGQLLVDAYEASGFGAFASILRVHLAHRDLGSVAVW